MSRAEEPNILEQDRVNELRAAVAKLQSEQDIAVKELKHRQENENSLFNQQEVLEYDIAVQEDLLKAAQETKKRAERERKAAFAQRDKLRREQFKVEEELEKFRMRGTFDEEENHVSDLREKTYEARKDLEAAQIELEMMRKFPYAGPELRPYLEKLRTVHRARSGSPNVKEEMEASNTANEASSTVDNESTAPVPGESGCSGDENKSSLCMESDSESDCKEIIGPRYRTPTSRAQKRRRLDSSSGSN